MKDQRRSLKPTTRNKQYVQSTVKLPKRDLFEKRGDGYMEPDHTEDFDCSDYIEQYNQDNTND